MADKNEFQEKTDIRDSVFLPPGKNEFRNQMNQSLALYSEGLDKLIGSLRLLERMLGELVKDSMLSEAYERFLQYSLAAEKNRPFHPGSIQASGDGDSIEEDVEHVAQEEMAKREKEQEEVLSADEGVRILMEMPQAEPENGYQTEETAEQEMEESMEETILERRGR